VPTSRSLRAAVRGTVKNSSWQAGDRRSAHFNLARAAAHAACRDGYHGASRGAEGARATSSRNATGCELDDVLAQAGGNTSRRTGLQRARSSHRCFGICAPSGARAGEVHGLPCRMSDVASVKRATCQSLDGDASATQSGCYDRNCTATLRKEGGLWWVRSTVPLASRPKGVCRRGGVCGIVQFTEELRVRFSDVGEWNRNRRHKGTASRTLKVRLSPLSDAQKALAGSFTGALPRWSLFRNRVH